MIGKRATFSALSAAVFCLCLRALIPAGYMPGNAFAGELFVLCPNGLPPSVAARFHDSHAGHHGDDGVSVDADQRCPIGAALQTPALPVAELAAALAVAAIIAAVSPTHCPVARSLPRPYDSRGPPRPFA